MQILNRAEAMRLGKKRYFTGRACKFGHVAERFVTTGGCSACNAERSRLFRVAARTNGRAFTYPLADVRDYAAAWAYCQALDLARGHVPAVNLDQPAITASAPDLPPPDVAAIRQSAFFKHGGQDTSSASTMEWRAPGEVVEPIRKPK